MSAALQIDMFAAPAMDRTVVAGDCRDTMRTLASDSVDSIVSDPPYGISFMGKGEGHQ